MARYWLGYQGTGFMDNCSISETLQKQLATKLQNINRIKAIWQAIETTESKYWKLKRKMTVNYFLPK